MQRLIAGRSLAQAARIALLSALTAFLYLVLPTWQAQQIRFETLDGGYRAVLNDQRLGSLEFGTELITTTGPFGFLRNRDYWPGRFGPQLAWDLLITSAFVVVIWTALGRQSLRTSGLVGAALLICLALIRFDIARLTNCLPVLYIHARTSAAGPLRVLTASLALATLAIGSWVLFSSLMLFTIVVLLMELATIVRTRRPSLYGLVFMAFLPVTWVATGNRVGALRDYMFNSLQVVGGYTEVMVRPGGFFELLPAIIAFGAVLGGILAAPRDEDNPMPTRLLVICGFTAVFVIAFRSAFVRFEVSRGLELFMVVALMALLLAVVPKTGRGNTRSVTILVAAYLLCLGGGWALIVRSPDVNFDKHIGQALRKPLLQYANLKALVTNPGRQRVEYDQTVSEIRRRFPLSHLSGPVGMHGNLPGLIIANGLDFAPQPVFQSFNAYTPHLIGINADFLEGNRAPATVVVELQRSLGYPAGLTDSRAWLNLFESYQPVELIDGEFNSPPGGLLVVRKADSPRRLTPTLISTGVYDFGSIIRVPPEWIGTPIWAVVGDRQTIFGRIGRTLLKLPNLYLDLELENGKQWSFKFTAAPAREGFLLSPQVKSVHEIQRLMVSGLREAPGSRVVVSLSFRQEANRISPWVRSAIEVSLFALQPALDH